MCIHTQKQESEFPKKLFVKRRLESWDTKIVV